MYGRVHRPPSLPPDLPGKVWLATAVALLAVLQLLSALAMYGRMPKVTPEGPWLGLTHRWTGRVAFLLSVPVAVHCLYLLGFQAGDARVLAHSLLGCLFYGAFVTKMLLLGSPDDTPGWALPAAGGVVFTAVTGLWLTSSLWFLTQ